jgi:hypothetical protein
MCGDVAPQMPRRKLSKAGDKVAPVTTPLPRDYGMWLRVRERGKLRAIDERAADVLEVQIWPEEFGAYCKGLKRTDFSITALDACARQKGIAQAALRCAFERESA